ncbi:hypothetical protein [Shewanella algae]|uniref:hypothetical protein n=1 Tax=Shewanella algae TaxID=38313 RepID=UPI0010214D34|nr:hypothetical protein [Shewanella algae]MBO2682805.1 hypothetical protein [Shewanella algae]
MAELSVQIRLLERPKGGVWKRLNEILKESGALSWSALTHDFHTIGDALVFKDALEWYRIKYAEKIEDDDCF